MEGKNQELLVKVSIVTGPHSVEAVVWKRGDLVMSDQDVDDVTFLTGTPPQYSTQLTTTTTHHTICQSSPLICNTCDAGGVAGNESPVGTAKKSLYENNGVAACSQRRALCIAMVAFSIFFIAAVIIAYAGPQSGKYNTFYLLSAFFLVLGFFELKEN